MTGSDTPAILIVTTKVDATADYVVMALGKRSVPFFRLNTEDLPERATSSFIFSDDRTTWRWFVGQRSVDLSNIRAVWYRRHRLPILRTDLSEGANDFCLRECDWFLRGGLLAQRVRWMSYPPAVAAAESKISQLSLARNVGFRIPRTIVTNDPVQARDFIHANSSVVGKAIRVGYINDGAHGLGIFSSLVRAHELDGEEENLRLAPVIFQEFIDKAYDLRVTVVGDRIFSARIDSQSVESARVDWRRSETADLPHAPVSLPNEVERSCHALLSRLGLSFGAIDLVVDKTGQCYFLEINPSGQWAWLQDRLGFDIAGAIADWLTGEVGKAAG